MLFCITCAQSASSERKMVWRHMPHRHATRQCRVFRKQKWWEGMHQDAYIQMHTSRCLEALQGETVAPYWEWLSWWELNKSDFLDDESSQKYQSMTGSLQWIISIGRFDSNFMVTWGNSVILKLDSKRKSHRSIAIWHNGWHRVVVLELGLFFIAALKNTSNGIMLLLCAGVQ